MILECDIGNTRCKWRMVEGGQVLERGSFALADGFENLVLKSEVERVRVASVVEGDSLAGFTGFCIDRGLNPEFAQSTAVVAGVVSAYFDVAKLGVDRWLGVVAGYKKIKGAVLIIDAGTALKADLVSTDGHHLGGYIAPGMGLMESSLLTGTDKIRFDRQDYSSGVAFGCSTADVVNAGMLAAQIGAVTVAIEEAKKRIPEGFAILLTGGDSASINKALGEVHNIEMVPDLVLDGLQWLLP
ncbi:MAG: type III pantothenate kinase [Oceanicoccus sp.]|uniref:type III pantothenate kinase n=1 Tax=Oceanicoccus sp. TaxID=2691044 RepID=UPI002618E172|nr:type III pantothenate kinase [Oceanicoccus sp.]MCP3909153.1 type III pantothenate kinase [Oceanicoccus sp.]MDG1772757.1 type III pantothenate kinase [Oceanicoccus sp.]